jgi:pyruvate dehydrogenase E2 component (dihydrolipoamide acetyltransferase)
MSTTPAGTAGAAAAAAATVEIPAAAAAPVAAAPAPAANVAAAAAPVPAAAPKATTMDALLANASDDLAAQVRSLISANTARQAALIQALEGKVGLSTDELKAMPIASLEKMAAKLNVAPADFSGAAPAATPAAAAPKDNSNFTAAPKVFEAPAPQTRQ